jgi:hypothetical protein
MIKVIFLLEKSSKFSTKHANRFYYFLTKMYTGNTIMKGITKREILKLLTLLDTSSLIVKLCETKNLF